MVDHSAMKLGKLPRKHDYRIKSFGSYLRKELPPPAPVSWFKDQTDFGTLLNDQLGDCTIASKLHGRQIVTLNAQASEFQATDAMALESYRDIDGYRDGDPSTDQGGIIVNVLDYIAKRGFWGGVLKGYCSVNPGNDLHVDQAIALFGVLDVGVQLPASAQTQEVWDLPEGQALEGDWAVGSWGGHDISIHEFDADGNLVCITWGAKKIITRRWFKTYCDEAYALLWADWIEAGGMSPSHFDYETLFADMAAIRTT
jgi:hypothetical protein